MTKPNNIVAYKPQSKSTSEFIVMVNPEEYRKWLEDESSVPLLDVVLSTDIFHSTTGHTGTLGRASKQEINSTFDTDNNNDAVIALLKKGTLHAADSLSKKSGDTNMSRGSGNVTSTGSVGGGR